MTPEELSEQLYGVPLEIARPQEREAVYVPGIRDVIHLTPKVKISAPEMAAHKAAAKAKRKSPLSEAQLEELQRRREAAIRISQSPTPEIVRSIGNVLTWFDDVGDAMTTGFWGGKGALYIASKIGLKVASRAVPYLGWALLVKDVVDVVSLFGLARKIGRIAKREKWRDTEINPFGKKAKLSRADKMAKKVPGFGAILEIAQTTDYLFGVGISFGPVVGFVEDLFFGAIKGVPVKPGWKSAPSVIDQQIKGMESGAFINGFGQEFSAEEHLYGIAAIEAGFQQSRSEVKNRFNLAVGLDVWDVPFYPRPVGEPATRFVLDELGINPDGPFPWHLPGNPDTVTLTELCQHLARQAPQCLNHWLKPLNHQMQGFVAGEMIDDFTMEFFPEMEGEGAEWSIDQTPIEKVLHALAEGKISWPEGASASEAEAWVEERIKEVELDQ